MDKAFENMDKRFKYIEEELNYNYDSSMWHEVESTLSDSALDNAFVNAANSTVFNSNIDFSSVDNAFLDDAFIDAAKQTKVNYQTKYFNEFKAVESDLIQNDSFVHAATVASAVYSSKYWSDANLALQAEGLHHEYKSDYWREAERLLLKDQRKAFFWKWSTAATILILLSVLGFNLNQSSVNELANTSNSKIENNTNKQTHLADKNTIKNKSNSVNTNNVKIIDNSKSKVVTNNNDLADASNQKTNNNTLNSHKTNNININSDNSNLSDKTKEFPNKNETNLINGTNKTKPHSDISKDIVVNDNLVKPENENPQKSPLEISEYTTLEALVKMDRNLDVELNQTKLNENLVVNKIEYTPLNHIHQFAIKFEKGLGNSFGSTSNVISPRNAMYIDYRFNPIHRLKNIQFGVDLGMYHMNLDNYELEKNYSVYSIEGGVEHFWYRMTYKDLIYMSTKFNTYIDLGKRSKLRLGIGVDRLMTSRIRLEYKNEQTETVIDEGNEWGVNDGINKIDLNFGIGYELKLNSKFSFLIDSRVGTSDKTNNEYLKVKRNDKDLSIQFGIKYNIFAIR